MLGRVREVRVREPLEDPGLSHGICADHKEQLLESRPSRSFPDAELLIVAHRNNITLYEHLARWVAGAPAVKVRVDRRATDRRSATGPVADERRHVRTRRIRQGKISPVGGYTVVRFTPKEVTPRESDAPSFVARCTLVDLIAGSAV